MEKHVFDTPRGPVAYWTAGERQEDRPTLVFLHGLTADHTMFAHQVEHFAPMYPVLCWDAPGHGGSRPYEGMSIAQSVTDLKGLLEEAGIERVVLIGQSLGGYFAQSFLDRYPDMVCGFVSIDSTPYGEGYYSASDRFILRQVEWMAYCYPLSAMKKAMAKQVCTTKEGQAQMFSMIEGYGKSELCHLMGIAYAGFLEDNRNITIHCPVLLMMGEHDKTGKVPQYNRAWEKKQGIPLHIIPHAGHNANVDNPAAVNRLIQAFLLKLDK